MFIDLIGQQEKQIYIKFLKTLGALSKLFSENTIPYLNYRVAENIFCKAFNAHNISRTDCAFDAKKEEMGIGIKTFLNKNGRTMQKIAEFNKDRAEYKDLIDNPKKFIKYISKLRNDRIEAANGILQTSNHIYHCIARNENKFLIFEEQMSYIDIDGIRNVKKTRSSIAFDDSENDYNFNLSKSTLFKRFITNNPLEIDVSIIDDPYEEILRFFEQQDIHFEEPQEEYEKVILPLYSMKTRKVEERSGLNQWNARGRPRDNREVYIPIPVWIHKKFPLFFPTIENSFKLKLPNGKVLDAKTCQTQYVEINGERLNKGKGLMSKPNKDLGKWILDDVLRVPERKLVTREMLENIGIDSVEIRKIDNENYDLNFKKTNSFEDFYQDMNNNF